MLDIPGANNGAKLFMAGDDETIGGEAIPVGDTDNEEVCGGNATTEEVRPGIPGILVVLT